MDISKVNQSTQMEKEEQNILKWFDRKNKEKEEKNEQENNNIEHDDDSQSQPTNKLYEQVQHLKNNVLNLSPSTSFNRLTTKQTKTQQSEINEYQLKAKLILLFKRDKQKNHQICDYFMNDLGLNELCDNIKKLIEYISMNDEDTLSKKNNGGDYRLLKNEKDKEDEKQHILRLSNQKLSVFPQNVNFIASIFSRDKIQILLQLHGINHKILNFLNYLHFALKSFIFTNQKQWILMKDEIERYLSKYEKNVEKIYELDEDQEGNEDENQSGIINRLLKIQCNNEKRLQRTKQIKKIRLDLNKKFSRKFTLQNYKSQTNKVRKKLIEHQQSMTSALRKSCFATYDKFQHIVEQLKDEMLMVIGLLDKTNNFKQSKEKHLIKQFLLESRKIGVQGLIFLELIYKHVIEKLEKTRRKIVYESDESTKKKLSDNGSNNNEQYAQKQYKPICKKQRCFIKQVDRIFEKLEKTLLIKKIETYNNSNRLFEPQIEIDDSSQSKDGNKEQQCFEVNVFQVEEIKENFPQKQQKQAMDVQLNKVQAIAELSENQKFISSVIQEKISPQTEQISKKSIFNQQEKVPKKKRIRKSSKTQEKKQEKKPISTKSKIQNVSKNQNVEKKQFSQSKKSKIQPLKPMSQMIQNNILPPIESQDEQNHSSSSLQFLTEGLQNSNKQQTTPKKHSEDLSKKSVYYSSMKKNNNFEEFQSLSLDIPLCLQYEDQEINMQDIDQLSHEQESSFYNDVIENKGDQHNKE